MNERDSQNIVENDDRKFNLRRKQNNDNCQCECKKTIKHRICHKDLTWNPSTGAWKYDKDFDIGKYLKECVKTLADELVDAIEKTSEKPESAPIKSINKIYSLCYLPSNLMPSFANIHCYCFLLSLH